MMLLIFVIIKYLTPCRERKPLDLYEYKFIQQLNNSNHLMPDIFYTLLVFLHFHQQPALT